MRHPWRTSETGSNAQALRYVQAPATWTGPVYLSFYCSDDYQALPKTPQDPGYLRGEGFPGRRFKQIMVNGKVVWSADAADAVTTRDETLRHRVALPVEPGERFLLALVAYDVDSSATQRPEDFYDAGVSGETRESDPGATHFMTHVYWGDLLLTAGGTEVPPGTRPSLENVRAVHARRWPVPAFGEAWEGDKVPLHVSAPAGIPAQGFPLSQGIPLPASRVDTLDGVRLQTVSEGAWYTQKTVLRNDPEEAPRWMLVEFPLDAQTETLTLAFAKDGAKPKESVKIADSAGGLTADAAGIGFGVGDVERLLTEVRLGKEIVFEWITPLLRVNGSDCATVISTVSVLSEGPFHAQFAADGVFEHDSGRVASFTAYVSVYAGLPYVRLYWRVFNDTEKPLHAEAMTLRFQFARPPAGWRAPGAAESVPTLTIHQEDEITSTVNGSTSTATEPFYIAWEGGCVAPRWFRERYPSGVHASGNTLDLHFAAGRETPIVFTPGEATTHEVWLALGDMEPAQFAATVAQPPVLHNAEYFCAIGVLGPALPATALPGLAGSLAAHAGAPWGEAGHGHGVRHFPGSPYIGGLPNWSNDYPSRMLSLWSAWLFTGERAWYDRAEAVSRHLTDVAVIHSGVPATGWVGGMHGPGSNHVAGPWNPTLRNSGLGLFAAITGAPGAEEAFLGLADFCMRTGAGMDAPGSRHHAAPLDTVAEAWLATGDLAFRDEALLRVARLASHLDARRGTWPEAHGSRVYRGNVPFMAAQLARPLYWLYTMTGDVAAAQVLVGLAESVAWENVDWEAPGQLNNYSHNPRYAPIPQLDLAVLPLLLAGHELSEDPFLLETATAVWKRWEAAPAFESVFQQFWDTPWLLHQLDAAGLLEEEPPPPLSTDASAD
jgi:hypothetical protein